MMSNLKTVYETVARETQATPALLREAMVLLADTTVTPGEDGVYALEVPGEGESILVSTDGHCSVCEEDDDLPTFGASTGLCVHALALRLHHGLMPSVAVVPSSTEPQRHTDLHSMTVKAWNKRGFEFLICVREPTLETLMDSAKIIATRIHERAWMSYDEYQETKRLALPAAPAVQEPVAPTPVPTPPSGGGQGPFTATELKPMWSDTRQQWNWRVFGHPRFHKHGLPIWEEALVASGLDPDQMDNKHIPDVRGWRAEWTEQEDREGKKRQKVVLLSKS